MKKEQIGKKCIEFTKEDVINLIVEQIKGEGYIVDEDAVVSITRKLKWDEWIYELESIKVYISEGSDDSKTDMAPYYFDEVCFDNRKSAQDTLDYLRECILDFGYVTVYDLHSVNDLPTNYRHMYFGWTNLDEIEINTAGYAVYKINFPPLERVH